MKFLEGYKTKIGIAALIGFAAAGYWFGVFSGAEASVLLVVAWTAFGLADKFSADRFAAFVLAALDRAKEKKALEER